MKKKLFLAAIILVLGCNISFAQKDTFFTTTYSEYREVNEWGTMPILPTEHGGLIDYTAVPDTPIGSGLLLLAGMGLAYGLKKRNK